MADKTNPNEVWGPNQNYADRVGLAPARGLILAPGGLTVDRNRINKTLNVLDKNEIPAKPLGQSHSNGQ